MTDVNPNATSRDNDLSVPATTGSLPLDEHARYSPSEESLEDSESPKHSPPKFRTDSLFQASNTEAQHTKTGKTLVLAKAAETWQESPSSICLCQPEPKVPRPRNAFILYRQHNQAAVVAQNPGLANPEISKIIGDHWRNSSKDTKAHWKLLADEEKIRHQKQYPDYRYQPRRSGRNSSIFNTHPSNSLIEGEPHKCSKCGGRSINSSTMMSGPGIPSQNTPATPYSPIIPLSNPNTSTNVSRFLRGAGSPATGNGPPGYRSRPRASNTEPLMLGTPRIKHTNSGQPSPRLKRPEANQRSPQSPEPKRRRITNAAYAPVRAPNGPGTPFPFAHGQRRQSLPRAELLGPSPKSPFAMGPPPRPIVTQNHPDTSLTLAPIQSNSMGMDTQAKSLEAMVLSIPTLGKICVLTKISPPLAPPGPASPARPTRGLVIAIDAEDTTALDQMTQTLARSLEAYAVRVFKTPMPPSDEPPSFQAYLRLVDRYHTLSTQVVEYITTAPRKRSPPPVSPKSFPSESERAAEKEASIPVAILPGWQVTRTDWFASHVTIRDAYSPMNHWQWGATLWRDVVGADVTVAVQPAAVQEESPTKSFGGPREGNAKGELGSRETSGHIRLEKSGTSVDVRLEEARAVIVRGEKDGIIGEGALRRVGFEVGEWVRGFGEKEERRRRGS